MVPDTKNLVPAEKPFVFDVRVRPGMNGDLNFMVGHLFLRL